MLDDKISRELGSISARLNNIEKKLDRISDHVDFVRAKVYAFSAVVATVISVVGIFSGRLFK